MGCKESVWLKDRFKEPLKNAYRDIILQVKIPGTGGTEIWAEIQFHLEKALKNKNDCQHDFYAKTRGLPNMEEITKKVVDFAENHDNDNVKELPSVIVP